MNHIKAKVSDIQSIDNITIVSFLAQDTKLQMMSLSLNTNIKINSHVLLGVKASSVALAKDLTSLLSISNQIKCKIKSINNGKLISSIKLELSDDTIESLITKDSSRSMNLQVGDNVVALVKSSELSILKVLD